MLSSPTTFVTKYIVGSLGILLIGIAVLTAALHPREAFPGAPPPPGIQWLLLSVWLIASAGILRFTVPLKRVELRGARLYVSSYFREWEIVPRDILSVRQNRWVNGRPVRVELRHDVEGLGSSFTFIPPTKYSFQFWQEDPQVDDLRRFAETRPAPSASEADPSLRSG